MQIPDVRSIGIGAVGALTAGLLMGASMKPDLLADHRPEGPQIVANWVGTSTGPFDPGADFIAYRGAVPDYVIGADVARYKAATPGYEEPEPVVYEDPMPQADGVTEFVHMVDAPAADDAALDADVVVPKDFSWSG